MSQRMGGPFVALPSEVIERLAGYSKACLADYAVMVNRFYVEHIEVEGEWILGRIEANITTVARRIGVSRGWFRKRIWPTWTEIGVARQTEEGFIELPMFYKKGEVFQISIPVRRELKRLTGRLADQDKRIKELESELQERENAGNGTEEASSRPQRGLIPASLRPHPGLLGVKSSSLKVLALNKITLSGNNVVTSFYSGIGQKRISTQKRERGLKVFEKLRKDGFDIESIAFAVEWTLENANDPPYDFAIIGHTIGQAIADREKTESEQREAGEREKADAEERAQRHEELREREEVEAYKANLSPEDRAALRERAELEISAAGLYNAGFISDPLIRAKENEIVRERLKGD